MASNFRVYWKHAQIFQDLPAQGDAGGDAGDPVVTNGDLVGINLWGTGAGEGIPAGSDYGMVALDGTPVVDVTLAGPVTEGHRIYIDDTTNTLTDSDGAGANILFGYADEPSAAGTVRIGVRIKAQVNA